MLNLPHPDNTFDFAISVAAVHHLSTRKRRVEAIKTMLRTLRHPADSNSSAYGCGHALIFVWALEQRSSRRGWGDGDEQDVLVPWVKAREKHFRPSDSARREAYQRYYHLYREGELEEDVIAAGGRVFTAGYDRDNWWVVAKRLAD